MNKPFPLPVGADKKSENAINAMKEKLGHLCISKEEIDFIINGIMKAQEPRDKERAEKAEQKHREKAEKAALKRAYRSHQ